MPGAPADPGGVVVTARGPLPAEGELVERAAALAEDVERLVDQGDVPVDAEPHRHRSRRLPARRAGVAGEQHARAGQVGRRLGGQVEDAFVEVIVARQIEGREQARRPLVDEAEGGLDHHREPRRTPPMRQRTVPAATGERTTAGIGQGAGTGRVTWRDILWPGRVAPLNPLGVELLIP